MSLKQFSTLLFSIFLLTNLSAQTDPAYPNILLVIADDLGVDVSNGYHQNNLMPTTPTLDSLRGVGLTFDNVFSAPICTPTRAAIMSAKYGVKTGVTTVPGNLDLSHTSLFDRLETESNGTYSDAVIGKWHIASPVSADHPIGHGVDYYMGVLSGAVPDYYAWNKTENGITSLETDYVTSVFTDAAVDWIQSRNSSWFLWLAHIAPHTPFHLPPAELYSINATDTDFRKYIAAIEALDHELNRTLNAMTPEVRANTLIIYIGDNGTPNSVLRNYPSGHGKGSLYQGGIRVPMIVAGAGVSRIGEREEAMIHVADIHATVLEAAGASLLGGVENSLSFYHLLSGTNEATRSYNYTEVESSNGNGSGWTIRNDQYKLINFDNGTQEFYDLLIDSFEVNNLLLVSLTAEQELEKNDLELEAMNQRNSWSCRDHIQNGDEEGIDCGGSFCADCVSAIDEHTLEKKISIHPNPTDGLITIEVASDLIQTLEFYSLNGALLQKIKYKGGVTAAQINIDESFPQMLLVKITTDAGVFYEKVLRY